MPYIKRSIHPVSLIILFFIGCAFFYCKPEDEVLDFTYSGGLEFSTDTVLFDTLFTGAGSITKRFKVYNPQEKALQISNIRLGGGSTSPYKMYINGLETAEAENVGILGKDSMLILVEAFIDPLDEDSPYLVTDSVMFDTNGNEQQVKLVAWGQDANYLGNVILACNTTWTNQRPYVLYSSVLVDSLCQLNIEQGTKIFCSKGTYIYVKGKIAAVGLADERIIFRNDRLDPAYENTPGQWGGIHFLPGSKDNVLNFTVLKNAVVGIQVGTPDQDTIPDIFLRSVIIENMSNAGLLAFTSDIYAENLLINNCIDFDCANVAGGNYTYKQCTFANYSFNFIRESPSFYVSDNYTTADNNTIIENIFVELNNCIIFGNMEDELYFNLSGGADYVFSFTNSLFKTTLTELDTLGNILNEDPKFTDPAKYNYRLDSLSPAINAGVFDGVEFDLDGVPRDSMPDMGAYERIE